MCGRYILFRTDAKKLLEKMGVIPPAEPVTRYNISPGTEVLTVRMSAEPALEMAGLRWGMLAPGRNQMLPMARSEGVAESPVFKSSFRKRRCVLPASGYYEWQVIGKRRQAYAFRLAAEEPFFIAGIWNQTPATSGPLIETCAVLTRSSLRQIAGIHPRMPVIFDAERAKAWVAQDNAAAGDLLRDEPDLPISASPVSAFVNAAGNEGPDCLQPALPITDPQLGFGFE